jgi:hypothetical protein
VLKRSGYGFTWQEGSVVTWGGLRGAVGLSLALMVAQNTAIADTLIRTQTLQFGAGIVVLSLLINGTTVQPLLDFLGLTRILPARLRMLISADRRVQEDTEETLQLLQNDRFLCGADWAQVRGYLPHMDIPDADTLPAAGAAPAESQLDETRRRLLEAEKQSYWRQFHEGTLGPIAVRSLVSDTAAAFDAIDQGAYDRDHIRELWRVPPRFAGLEGLPLVGGRARDYFFNRLALGYDIARGFVTAQEDVTRLLSRLEDDADSLVALRRECEDHRESGMVALKGMHEHFPEISVAIETRTAAWSMLRHVRHAIHRLQSEGVLDDDESSRWIEEVEAKMKELTRSPPAFALPDPIALLRELAWLRSLDDATIDEVVAFVRTETFEKGKPLMTEGGAGDSLVVITKGTVNVSINTPKGPRLLHYLGPGNVIGEMAVLSRLTRTATVTAETTVEALSISAADLRAIMQKAPQLESDLWRTAGSRFAENLLIQLEPFSDWGAMQLRRWLLHGRIIDTAEDPLPERGRYMVLLSGDAVDDYGCEIKPPAVLRARHGSLASVCRLFVCPPLESGERE